MGKVSAKDVYAQRMYLEVTTVAGAENDLTWARVNVGMAIFEYAAFILHRVEFDMPRGAFQELIAATDEVQLAVSGSNSLTSISARFPQIYALFRASAWISTAVSSLPFIRPWPKDFTGLPGGGLIIPAQDVFFGVDCDGFASTYTFSCAVDYSVKQLQAADYLELAQSYRVLST